MVDILVVTPVFDISIRPHNIYHDRLLWFTKGQNKQYLIARGVYSGPF